MDGGGRDGSGGQMKRVGVPPGFVNGVVDEICGEDDGKVSSSVKLYNNFSLCDGDSGRHVHDISE